jgi:predicted flap endonuclease-1-like 5' DNA nuclease
MSNWFVFLIGIIGGIFFGIISARKNYESCQEQLTKLEADIQARKEKLARTEEEIDETKHHLAEVSEKVNEADATAQKAAASAVAVDVAAEALAVDTDESGASSEIGPPEADLETVTETPAAVLSEAAPESTAEAPDVEFDASRTETGLAAAVDSESGEAAEEHVSECPQKLARIKGIGRVYEDKLYQAGIGSFWQVATASTDELATIFGLKNFQAVDLDGIRQAARQLAEETGTTGLIWNGHQPDDMEHLPGIGKTYEGRLYDAGVCTWEKLAALSPEELTDIVKAPKWSQPDYDAWIAYAKEHLSDNA